MRPSSVFAPVATTTACALPAASVVPRNRRERRSATGASSGAGSVDFSTATLSPVRADSSARTLAAVSRRRSAGTRSPAARRTMSPGTNSPASTCVSWPLRRTRATACPCLRRASSACRARHSVKNPTRAFTSRTTPMATASTVSPVATATPAAPISSSTIRLANCSRSIRQADLGFASGRALGPYRSRRRVASSPVSPRAGSTPSASATSAAGRACGAGTAAAGAACFSAEAVVAVADMKAPPR